MSCGNFLKLLLRSRKSGLTRDDTLFDRCLTVLDVVLLGMGSMLGPGLYVATGQIARDTAGPAIVISLMIAALPAILSSFCYAEFAARVSRTGSSYVYTYLALGEIWAFMIGWNLILENVLASALLANEFSKLLNSISGKRISKFMTENLAQWTVAGFQPYPDFIAFFIVIVITVLAATGSRKPALFMRFATMINLLVVLFVVLSGFYFMDTTNWETLEKFAPFGFNGIMAGASISYFSFLGFDIINSASEETDNPLRVVPFANAVSTYIGVFIYLITAAILTLIIPYDKLGFNSPLTDAFAYTGFEIGKYLVATGGFFGMTTALLTFNYAGTRLIYAMADDGLLFQSLAKVSDRTRVPIRAGLIFGFSVAIIALFLNLDDLVEMMSIGTLMAYTAVSVAVLLERYRPMSSSELSINEEDYDKIENEPSPCCGRLCRGIKKQISAVRVIKSELGARFGDKPSEETHRVAGIAAACLLFAGYGFSLTISPASGLPHVAEKNPVIILVSCLMAATVIFALAILFLLPTEEIRIAQAIKCTPFVPLTSILTNIYLLTNLSRWTWARVATWMFLGMAIYFLYGIHKSKVDVTKDDVSRDFLDRLLPSAQGEIVHSWTPSSEEEPMSPSSDSENDEGFQSNLMTSEDESPKHTYPQRKQTRETRTTIGTSG